MKAIKAWITKYALTKGIYETEALECNTPGAIQVPEPGDGSKYYHDEGKEWCKTKKDAYVLVELIHFSELLKYEKQSIKTLQAGMSSFYVFGSLLFFSPMRSSE